MVTESAALVSLGEGDGVAAALGLDETVADGLGDALVSSGLGLAVPAGGLVHPVSAMPLSTPPSTSAAKRRPIGEPVIGECPSLPSGSRDGRVEVT